MIPISSSWWKRLFFGIDLFFFSGLSHFNWFLSVVCPPLNPKSCPVPFLNKQRLMPRLPKSENGKEIKP